MEEPMPALTAGKKAPDFTLPTLQGAKFSLEDALQRGPVIAVFFKISCPVCQYALPFIDRMHKGNGDKVTIVGISQNSRDDTLAFIRQYGVTFPVLLDDPSKYPVSNAYGITNVPTAFVITQDSEIELLSVGWSKRDMEKINARAAQTAGNTPAAVFHPGEEIAEFRAG
jgi:peroxiredoxin